MRFVTTVICLLVLTGCLFASDKRSRSRGEGAWAWATAKASSQEKLDNSTGKQSLQVAAKEAEPTPTVSAGSCSSGSCSSGSCGTSERRGFFKRR